MSQRKYTKKLVNVVGGGDIHRELDLAAINQNLSSDTISETKLSPARLSIKLTNHSGTVIIYRSGKYSIMGSNSQKDLFETNDVFLDQLQLLGIETDSAEFRATNHVFSVDLGRSVDIVSLAQSLPEVTQFEPEQYAHLIYKPDEVNATMTIAASGKSVVNTPDHDNGVEKVIESLSDFL